MWLLKRLFSRSPVAGCSQLLHTLLAEAIALGLPLTDVQNAQEMLDYDERVLCFDIIGLG